MEVLSNSSTIAEICRKYNVASSAVYMSSWIHLSVCSCDGTGQVCSRTVTYKKIEELKAIIGELTIANETLKKFKLRGEVGGHEHTYAA
ncbi:MAG: hypothetical protein M1166_01335 [Candidatus Thermoplasmatota archaeon]|nr:hypothetical protein [Candidatus Thermoplasmatota archaeon]